MPLALRLSEGLGRISRNDGCEMKVFSGYFLALNPAAIHFHSVRDAYASYRDAVSIAVFSISIMYMSIERFQDPAGTVSYRFRRDIFS